MLTHCSVLNAWAVNLMCSFSVTNYFGNTSMSFMSMWVFKKKIF